MKNNIENIPSEVFDWLSTKSFDQLNSQQKQIVLQYFTIDEYDELGNSTKEINTFMKPTQKHRQDSKELLMNKFDEVYSQPKQRFLVPRLLRYAAIVILSIGLGYQLRFWMQPLTTNQVVFQPVVDTVYLNNSVESTSASFLEDKDSVPRKVAASNGSRIKRNDAYTPVSKKQLSLNFNVVSVQDAKNKANIPKGNSCKSDSLRRKFGYVSL